MKIEQMKHKIFTFLALFLPFVSSAQTAEESTSFADQVDAIVFNLTDWFVQIIFYEIPFTETISVPWVLFVLVGGALFFTIYYSFPNIRLLGVAGNVIRGKYDEMEKWGAKNVEAVQELDYDQDGDIPETIRDESADGEVTHFQALTAALSATVGLGNIAGVAIALAIGGPGATFWMIIAGLIGMSSKFTECTLGVKYRDVGEDGTVYGGPMYYLKKGLTEKGLGGLGKVLAILFAIFCVGGSFGGGNMFQANQAAAQFTQLFGFERGWPTFIFGVVMAIFVGIVIIGGIKKIGAATEKIVPFMAGIYVLGAVIILVINYNLIPSAFGTILSEAFNPQAVGGGIMGVLIQGFRRGTFSNEAGVGSAAIAHSAVKTKYPASEGIVALLEPFIDTVVICTMTALVVIITDKHYPGEVITYGDGNVDGVTVTANAFNTVIPHFDVVLTIAVILFAFSTMLSWSYYGLQSWKYLFGKSKVMDYVYKAMFLLAIILGSTATLTAVFNFSDAMIFSMVVPNMVGLFILRNKVKEELKRYLDGIKKIYS